MPTVIPGQSRQPAPDRREPVASLPHETRGDAAGGGTEAASPRIDPPKARGPLSHNQKAKLAIAARSAFDKHHKAGLIDNGQTFDDWRHAECSAATDGRVGGFREATQRDYRLLRGHFANLNGDGATAIQDAIHGSPDEADLDQARAILRRECRTKGHAYPEYPAAICRQQYKRPLSEASIKQLWSLIYTVRNRKKKPSA